MKAYDIERSASFPRVVLDEELAKHWCPGESILDREGKKIGHVKTWRRCWRDGKAFFDHLQPIGATSENLPPESLHGYLRPARELAMLKLQEKDLDEGLRSKYVWLAEYYNAVLDEYAICDVDRIPI